MQHLILLIVLLLIAGLTFTVTRWKGGLHMTFSRHAATNRGSKIFYALLFLVTTPMLLLFFMAWFVPTKHLPTTFLWFATIASIFQILCTWIPEVGGRKTVVHRILAGVSAVALLPLVYIIAIASQISTLAHYISWSGLLLMLLILGIALANQKAHRFALLLQIAYFAIFFIVILTTTYL